MNKNVILETNFPTLKLFRKGKVRDVYSVGNNYLIFSTDRLSAFDVIMSQGIPDKGKVLTQISLFWFELTKEIIPNHLITADVEQFPEECLPYKEILRDRSMIVKKAKVFPVEAIVRGYISGSGWEDYKNSGEICGIKLPGNLVESEKLPEPLFTPSTKAEIGDHDENISIEKTIKILGEDFYIKMKNAALEIFNKCSVFALSKGIIIADTKMEFGVIEEGKFILVDELLTPDSSRFWSVNNYQKGRTQKSFDKQFIRDYLLSINFNKQPPPPELPQEIISKTEEKYKEILLTLTGKEIK